MTYFDRMEGLIAQMERDGECDRGQCSRKGLMQEPGKAWSRVSLRPLVEHMQEDSPQNQPQPELWWPPGDGGDRPARLGGPVGRCGREQVCPCQQSEVEQEHHPAHALSCGNALGQGFSAVSTFLEVKQGKGFLVSLRGVPCPCRPVASICRVQ